MATQRQVDANRRNALKSTGPRTDEGKSASRRNALRHGLAAVTLSDPDRAEAVESRRAAWAAEIGPETEQGAYALDLAVSASFRLDDCEIALQALAVEQANRADVCWDEDRQLEAARLADGLSRRPDVVALELQSSRHGCELLIGRWERLGEALDVDGAWTADERSAALDLLGLPRALRRGRTPLDPAPGGDEPAHRRAVVRRQIDRLVRLKDRALDPVDDLARRQALTASMAILSKPGQLIARYERDAYRRFQSSLRVARARAEEAEAIDDEAPAPVRLGVEPEPDFEIEDAAVDEPVPVEPERFPTTPDEIRATLVAIEARAHAAKTPAERPASRIEMESALVMFGPELGLDIEEPLRLARRHRDALAAFGRPD